MGHLAGWLCVCVLDYCIWNRAVPQAGELLQGLVQLNDNKTWQVVF